MGKTRAQYQKEYRERKKKEDKDFLKKERERTRSYKLPIQALDEEKRSVLREKNKMWKRRSRENIKRRKQKVKELNQNSPSNVQTTDNNLTAAKNTRSCAEESQALTVKLDFHPRQRKQKRSKALRTASKKINNLEQKIVNLIRENKKLRKRNERMVKAHEKTKKSTSNINPDKQVKSTPKSKANAEIRELGLTPRKVSRRVKKKLVMANAMIAEIQSSSQKNKTQKKRRVVANIVSGRILRRYRCLEMMSKETGISRNVLKNAKSKRVVAISRRREVFERERIKKRVVDFLERDDVSINMPGKNDCKKRDGGDKGDKLQVRVLTDYLSNLFEKFTSENPDVKISRAVFCRLRPSHIMLTKLITRNTCLCSKHQNIAMKLKCLRSLGIDISPNPETVSKNVTEEQMCKMLNDGMQECENVEFEEWKRVEADGKKKMRIVKTSVTRDEFTNLMNQQFKEFLHHVHRVKTQYTAIRNLKADLPKNQALVHMDFAENFTCSNTDEVQSAYWNATTVTLHPIVVYYKADENLEHRNFIFVSDVPNHNSTAVYTILKKLIPELKTMMPGLQVVHYWTDSPSSQYRNKYIIDILRHHTDLFQIQGRWNYFESGHGKGPCDGLGGVAKRQAAEACKQGKVNIQDAFDFYRWANNQKKSIDYIFYTGEDYEETATELEARNPKMIPGTMKLHALLPVGQELYSAEVSCYCEKCLTGKPCEKWKNEHIKQASAFEKGNKDPQNSKKRKSCEKEVEEDDRSTVVKPLDENTEAATSMTESENVVVVNPVIDMYALVKWDDIVYPAKIVAIDKSKRSARASFMEESKRKGGVKLFKWPERPDIEWVEYDDIVCEIEEPSPCSKSKRQFKLNDNAYNFIDLD